MNVAHRQTTSLCLPAVLAAAAGLLASETFGQTPTWQPDRVGYPTAVRTYSPSLRSTGSPSSRRTGYVSKRFRTAAARTPQAAENGVPATTDNGTPATDEKAAEGPTIIEEKPAPAIMPEVEGPVYESCAGEEFEVCDGCQIAPCCCISPFSNLELFSGVQGFTGPANRGGSAGFGFYEGVNWAFPLPGLMCLSGQLGARGVHSNFSGAGFTTDAHNQVFVTGGLFHRVDVGFQGGVVVDYLRDDWYREADLLNLRGELSWRFRGVHDLGFWFSTSTKQSQVTSHLFAQADTVETWEATDLYAFFYRRQLGACRNGDARLFAGWSNHSDGLLGADLRLPLGDAWALEAGLAYLIPQEGAGPGLTGGHAQESWNLSVGLSLTPGSRGGLGSAHNRALIRVADNGSFMMDRVP